MVLAARALRHGLGGGAGALQAYRGSHVVITTIMFNFIAAALLVYLLVEHAQGARQHGARERAPSPTSAQLPGMHEALAGWASSGRARR